MFNVLSRLIPCYRTNSNKYQRVPHSESYDAHEESCWSPEIKKIVEEVLIAENQPNSKYQQVIQRMLDKLTEHEWPRDIHTLVACRFQVLESEESAVDELPKKKRPIWSMETDEDKGKFLIFVPHGIGAMVFTEIAFPYLVSREVYHILEHDRVQMHWVKKVISCASGVLICDAERRVDEFASRHSTPGQREYALNFERDFWYAK